MQRNAMQGNAVKEGHTSSSIFSRSSTTGSKFAASLGKNLTTTLYPLNHRQMYVTAKTNTNVEQPAHASGVPVRAWQSAKQTSLHSQDHRLSHVTDRRQVCAVGLCSCCQYSSVDMLQCTYLMAWLEVIRQLHVVLWSWPLTQSEPSPHRCYGPQQLADMLHHKDAVAGRLQG